MRQRSSWYVAGSYCWAERAKGKSKMQSTASRIQKKRLFTVGPRKKSKDKSRQQRMDSGIEYATSKRKPALRQPEGRVQCFQDSDPNDYQPTSPQVSRRRREQLRLLVSRTRDLP